MKGLYLLSLILANILTSAYASTAETGGPLEAQEEDDLKEEEELENSKRLWGTPPASADSSHSNVGNNITDDQPVDMESTSLGSMEAEDVAENEEDNNKRLWGASSPSSDSIRRNSSTDEPEMLSTPKQHEEGEDNRQPKHHQEGVSGFSHHAASHESKNYQDPSQLPFVKPSTVHVTPPEGFVVTARVYTDPADKLAHFDSERISLPYYECGAVGSTTPPIPILHAYFRHSLRSSPWCGTEYGPHPQLVIVLTKLEMELNSGESRHFLPGLVILLEDVITPGHKIRSESNDMTVLLLTLPQHYHGLGKDRASVRGHGDPCPTFLEQSHNHRAHKVLLGIVGLSLSALAADFLGRVAPLWLAVAVGGSCFIAGGTYGFVKGGDYLLHELEMWQDRKRLAVEDSEDEA